MKKIMIFALMALMVTMLMGCETNNQDRKDTETVDQQQEVYGRVHPVPRFDFSIPRKAFIQIYTALTTEVNATYTIVVSATGQVLFKGPSIGMPIPYDTQLTNPLRVIRVYSGEYDVIEQPEPNGLWTSKNTKGTYVLAVTREGLIVPLYFESEVNCFPYTVVKGPDGDWVKADYSTPAISVDLPVTKEALDMMASERGITPSELPLDN